MDFTMITGLNSAITAAKELGKAALGVRDFNEIAPIVAKLNDQLLDAQQALFRHNAELLALQQKHFETTQELAKAKETIAQRGRYTLVEVAPGSFAYRANVQPMHSGAGDPTGPQVEHHVCQLCFDKGIKAVLQGSVVWSAQKWTCPSCSTEIDG